MTDLNTNIKQNVMCECDHPKAAHDDEGCTQTVFYTEECYCIKFKEKIELHPGDICLTCGYQRSYHSGILKDINACDDFVKITEVKKN